MSLDQRLTRAAQQVAAGVTPPEVDLAAVRDRAHRNQRRTTSLAVAATVLAVVAVGVGVTIAGGKNSSAPDPVVPVPTPTPTETVQPGWVPDSFSAEDIVNAPGAVAAIVGIAADDPDVRMSVWTSTEDAGIAVTGDGYKTTTYVAAPGAEGGFEVSSLRDGLFLLTDVNKTQEFLVGVDGTSRRVVRVRGEVMPTELVPEDDRLWFQCADGGWRYTWCALDPDTAKAYVWPRAWDGSAVRPGQGAEPWGSNPEPRAVGSTGELEVWWGAGSDRRVRALAAARDGDYVLGCPPGLMALWSHADGASTVGIHTSRDRGATWQTKTFTAQAADLWWQVRCAPDGSFVAASGDAGLRVWRTDGGNAFDKVLEVREEGSAAGLVSWTPGDPMIVAAGGTAAYSTDSGKTWTTVRTWR